MNIVVDALSRIREVNMLSFIEIASNLYDHLRGKYPDHCYFVKYWARVESGTDTTTSLLGNMSLRMEPDGTGCKIGTDRLRGQRCKYAEKSYMYKYDLGHRFHTVVIVVVVSL